MEQGAVYPVKGNAAPSHFAAFAYALRAANQTLWKQSRRAAAFGFLIAYCKYRCNECEGSEKAKRKFRLEALGHTIPKIMKAVKAGRV